MEEYSDSRKQLKTKHEEEQVPLVKTGPCFQDLPLQLYYEIFKFFDVQQRNLIRSVSPSWDFVIKSDFGTKVVLHNSNVTGVCSADSYVELEVRNLTKLLCSNSHNFKFPLDLRRLEIIGMILSANFVHLLQQFPKLKRLKISRAYFETDWPLNISEEVADRFPKTITNLSVRYLKTFRSSSIFSHGPFRQQRFSQIFGLANSDQLILKALSRLDFTNLQSLNLYHEIGNDSRDIRNGDLIHWSGSHEHVTEIENDETMIVVSKLLRKALQSLHLRNVCMDNCPLLLPGITDPDVEDEVAEQDYSHLKLIQLHVEGVLTMGWEPTLNALNHLQTLYIVTLNASMVPIVKNIVRRCSDTLESLSIIIATLHNIVTNVELPQNEEVLQEEFDSSFISRCSMLKSLQLKYASRIIQLSRLPPTLTKLTVCGDVYDVHEYLGRNPGIVELELEISAGFFVNLENGNDRELIFSTPDNVSNLIKSYGLQKLVLTEYGAAGAHQQFRRQCRKRRVEGLNVVLDSKSCRLRRIHEQEELIPIPRLAVSWGPNCDRSKL